MKFWSQLKNKIKAFEEMPTGKQLKVIFTLVAIVSVIYVYLLTNPIVLSISYDDDAYDSYVEKRGYGTSFYSTESGRFVTTHGIDPFDIKVNYLFAPSEDLREAFDNGHITIEDLDRLDFDYWFKSNDE